MEKQQILDLIKGGLIVSCQALENEPLHSSFIMGRMALAAKQGGACAIRANTMVDILEIKKMTKLPVIGIIKRDYPDSPVYITPTIREVEELVFAGCEIIAMDATNRIRPGGIRLNTFFSELRKRYPEQLFMADIATFKEGAAAAAIGFDLVGTTLCGYTQDTTGSSLPNLKLIKELSHKLSVPIVAEGGIGTPKELELIYKSGAYTAVVGGAITRPLEITKKFVRILK